MNILQQKTAVAPIVEVRDQNDLPVGGAIVTFSISGGQAAFAGGAPQITVTTNAAGRAAASALNPLQAGPVRIQVQAAFQGQTATTTIAQTNAATAAEAAARAAEKVQGGSGRVGDGRGDWSDDRRARRARAAVDCLARRSRASSAALPPVRGSD